LAITTPALPDAEAVAESVRTWAANNTELAATLAAGTPPERALTRWSMELLRGHRTTEALAVMRAALALSPGDPERWTNYGALLNQENIPAEAAACLEHALALSPGRPDTWVLLGMARKKLGDPVAAEAAYREALKHQPNSIPAWQFLGLLKQEQRQYAEAIDCFTTCVKAGGTDASLFANLGRLYYQVGRIPETNKAYRRAASLDPANLHYLRMARKTSFLQDIIAGESVDEAVAGFKNSYFKGELMAENELADLFSSAFSLLSGFGYLEAARRLGAKQLELKPHNPSVEYILKALAGDPDLDRSTSEYVVEHFDGFAEGFDAQLVDVLGYDVPEKICSAVRERTAAGKLYDTLDAGCGTGLCGPMLRPLSRRLTGVDLSPKMLDEARNRGIYDALACEDLIAYLGRCPAQFDLIVAADVMIYFGDLKPIFSGAAIALRPGGLLACSIESWNGAGFHLQPSGRFAQAPDYVRSLAAAEFEQLADIETTIRLEGIGRLLGDIFIFRRR